MNRSDVKSVVTFITIAILPSVTRGQCTPSGAWITPFETPTALNNVVNTLTEWDPDGAGPLQPVLVVGGGFTQAGGVTVNRTAIWNGSNWAAMGTGISTGGPQVMLSWDPDANGPALPQIAMGGFFTTVSGVTARNIAHWDGASWGGFSTGTQDGSGFPDVYTATLWDPDGPAEMGGGPLPLQLVIGGDFTVAGGASRRRLAIWDGTTWGNVGGGASDSVFAICTFDPDGTGPQFPRLVVGGFFTVVGSTAVNRVAMWNGTSWETMGAGFDAQVECMASVDPDGAGPAHPVLYAGGTFLNSGITAVTRVAQFTGGGWIPMSGGVDNRPMAMTSWDPDGAGPAGNQLVVCGAFVNAGGVTVNRIARYDGQWHEFGAGMNGSVNAVATWDADGEGPGAPMLVAGGIFTSAGGIAANRIAAWPVTTACAADFNCDAIVDFFDYLDFVDAFAQLLTSSDFNHDLTIDFFDYLDFVDALSNGC